MFVITSLNSVITSFHLYFWDSLVLGVGELIIVDIAVLLLHLDRRCLLDGQF